MPRLIIDLAEEAEIIGGIEANCRFCIVDESQNKHEFEVNCFAGAAELDKKWGGKTQNFSTPLYSVPSIIRN